MGTDKPEQTAVNETRAGLDSDTELTQPVRKTFQLISPEGHRLGIYETALEAASAAGGFWPGVGQSDGEGPGWDIRVVDSR